MERQLSGPEKRAEGLFDRLNMSDILKNEGKENSRKIFLNPDRIGTSIIKDGTLFSDYPPSALKNPKNYIKMVPNYWLDSDFLEVKGNVSETDWNSLWRDSLNDNIRIALLRMKIGQVPSKLRKYQELNPADREMVNLALKPFPKSNPGDRYYLHWESLLSAIPSPNQNLTETFLDYQGRKFPVKIVSGMELFRKERLFILDDEIMDRWEMLVGM